MSDAAFTDCRLTGHVRFRNFIRLREAGEAAIEAAGDEVVIDLAGLVNGNSVSVALLTAWYRAAESLGKRIHFVGAPAELENIVELTGLTDVLPVEGAGASLPSETFPAEAGQ